MLRVQTDDALQARDRDHRRAAARHADTRRHRSSRRSRRPAPREFRVEGIQDDAGVPAGGRRRDGLRPIVRGRRLHLHDEAEHREPAARRDGRRRRWRRSSAASTSWAWPSRSSPATARRTRSWCSCPASSDVRRAKDIIRSTARLELRLVEQGPFPSSEAALQAFNNVLPADAEVLSGRGLKAAGTAAPSTVYYVVKKVSAVCRQRPAQRPAVARRVQPAGRGFTLKQDAAAGSAASRRRTSAARSAIILDSRVMSSRRSRAASLTAARSPAFRARRCSTWSITLKSGALPASLDYLEERTVGPSLGQRFDRGRRDGVARRPRAGGALHALLLQADRPQRRRLDCRQPAHPARA